MGDRHIDSNMIFSSLRNMLLIGRIGVEYAAYALLVMPIIALIISTLFEGYRWTAGASLGVSLVLAGNLIVLTTRSTFRRVTSNLKAILHMQPDKGDYRIETF